MTKWSATGGVPQSSSNGAKTFTSTFGSPGTFNVTLTVDTSTGAQSVSHPITVDTRLTVPDLHGLTLQQAQQALAGGPGLVGAETSKTPSPLGAGVIVDTKPQKGSPAQPGDVVAFRTSQPSPYESFPLPSKESRWNGMAEGPDGNMWLTMTDNNKIARVTPEGAVTEFSIPTPNSGVYGIAAGPDGNLWFTEQSASKIGRITTRERSSERDPDVDAKRRSDRHRRGLGRQRLVRGVLRRPCWRR